MAKKLLIAFVLLAALLWAGHQAAQEYTQRLRTPIDGEVGYDTLREIDVNDTRQWVQVRGTNRDNPTLMFLHGGPGAPMMAMGPAYQNAWEQHFNVVQWDQRASGKTYFSQTVPPPSYTEMLADAVAVAGWARTFTGQERIYLLGHSWGTMLGSDLAREKPDWFSAYIATGMVVDIPTNERTGYAHTLHLAERMQHTEAVAELEALAPYPRADGSLPIQAMETLRYWQTTYGVGLSHRYGPRTYRELAAHLFRSPDYSLVEATFFFRDLAELWAPLYQTIERYDVRTGGGSFQVPVIFLLGRHDWQTPSVLAEDFFWHELEAPHKRLVFFENSAHTPFLDEPEMFARELAAVRQIGL